MARAPHAPTSAEVALAAAFRRHGLRFRREAKIRGYEADFYFPAARLTVEVDGYQHREIRWKMRSDLEKCETLAAMGIDTLRFSNAAVLRSPDFVAARVASEVTRRTRHVVRPACVSPRPRERR